MGSSDEDRSGRPVTIYDVAARAGVSIATVSHALNRPERVAERTRERVLASADALGFVRRGRGRAPRELRRALVAAPLTDRPSYLPRVLGVLDAARPAGVGVLVVDTSTGTDEPFVDALDAPDDVDGVILMGAEPTPRLAAALADRETPIVLVDRVADRWSCVSVDDEAGGALVADAVLAAGLTRPAWVSAAPPGSGVVTNGELRLRGFTARLRAAGSGADVPWIVCDEGLEGGHAAAADVAAAGVDAVFAMHDGIAAGLVLGLRERGVRVPHDVAVVGYDDGDLARALDLSTVAQPFRRSGADALAELRARRADPGLPLARIVLAPEFVARGTTPATPAPHDGPTTGSDR